MRLLLLFQLHWKKWSHPHKLPKPWGLAPAAHPKAKNVLNSQCFVSVNILICKLVKVFFFFVIIISLSLNQNQAAWKRSQLLECCACWCWGCLTFHLKRQQHYVIKRKEKKKSCLHEYISAHPTCHTGPQRGAACRRESSSTHGYRASTFPTTLVSNTNAFSDGWGWGACSHHTGGQLMI